MSDRRIEQDISLKNYEILNTIVPDYYRKKFPYTIIKKANKPELELTHKNINLVYIKDKNYFVQPEHQNKYKKGGVYGGSSGKITVYLL